MVNKGQKKSVSTLDEYNNIAVSGFLGSVFGLIGPNDQVEEY